ncbi:CDP-glycerol glycerophosphotransferase family protein [Streptomyces sp. DSM 42041]|uniref:CDP-glycerol glycerophosphotransferase family protein n=1 Tax=Streptomyces hazeniae TaxID=3075538 RepID=A0ABU2P0A2_9ACTN|nr:CDP-glycerol glycerophosphotransferase family protein [Streptomyces sp. DSM 42041]MDT0381647.1 CDP-glycerol glycerophosphotransferase family protein [Streptomyces sp. DSM 42041]
MSPRLSVVVPLPTTDAVLLPCLRSLAAQTAADLEVVLVDDGPQDAPVAAAARAFAAGDGRFRVVREADRPPGGPGRTGRARNAGLRHTGAKIPYLAFLEPEDTLPPTAYERLLGTLEDTGSDFATGNAVRLGADGRPGRTPLLGRPLDRDRPATHVTRHRNLARDRMAGTKVFRRAFWERHALSWPEEAGQTDLRLVVPAHFLATAVDVVGEPVLHRRDSGADRPEPGAPVAGAPRARGASAGAELRELVRALDAVSRFVHGRPSDRRHRGEDERHFDTGVLTVDLAPYLAAFPEADEGFQAEFAALARDFLTRVDPAVVAALPLASRIKWHLVREGRTDDLLAALAFERDNPHVFHVIGRGPRRAAAYLRPDGSPIEVPHRIGRVRSAEQPLHARLREARWQPDGTLLLRGYGYVRSAEADRPQRSRKFGWLRQGGGSRRRLPLRVRTVPAPEATRNSRQRTYSYDASGFEITVDPERLLTALRGDRRSASWTVCLGVVTGGLVRGGGVKAGSEGSGAQPPVRELPGDRRVSASFAGGRLRLTVEETTARLTGQRIADGVWHATLAVRKPHRPVALRMAHQQSGTEVELPVRPDTSAAPADDGWTPYAVSVATAELTSALATARAAEGEEGEEGEEEENGAGPDSAEGAARQRGTDRWRPALSLADETTCRIVVPSGEQPAGTPLRAPLAAPGEHALRELYAGPDAQGLLALTDRPVHPVADRVSWSPDGELAVEGVLPEAVGAELEVVWQHSGHRQEVTAPLERSGERFRTALRPAGAAPGELPLRQGRWFPFLRAVGAETRHDDLPVRLYPAALDTLPLTHGGSGPGGRAFTAERRYHDRLFLASGSDLAETERGAYGQHRLSTLHYPVARRQPLRDAVLYHSFDGRQYSDSPRAVHEEVLRRGTDVEHLWVVRDGQALVPSGAEAVVMGSARWHEALARSRWLIGNTHFPRWFARRDGQTAVQTWHGTPLKRIGLDLADTDFANRSYLESLPARAAEWSVLLSPNRFSTPILRRAFGYEGEVLESGYPRNDLLYAEDREKRAEEVRRRLDIPLDTRVVLYAPTWRDDNRYDRANCRFDLRLDLAAARAALGADHLLLVRKHYLVADSVPGTADGFVRDVSAHPDLAELLLVADVLVTDYSSVMFDFAHTGRPMLFHTYDLDHYRDVLRGFYFDFEQRAPGPLLSSSDEVIEALREVDAVADVHRDAYADFRRAFCDLDDGTAAARVVDRMFD